MVLTIAAAVFVFGLLVLVHELGHFVTAKMTGMRVDEFAIGFGPKLVSFQRGETVYSIRAIPLGGFNDIAGMDPEQNDAGSRGYCEKPVSSRMIVILAGSIMNLLLPAAEAGLRDGDRVLAIDGTPIATWSDFVAGVKDSAGKPVNLTVERGGESFDTTVTPAYDSSSQRAMVGVMGSVDTRYPGFVESAKLAVQKTGAILYMMVDALYKIVLELSGAELAGPIGVAQMAGEVAQMGFVPLLNFAAFLSLNLGIVNLFPIPALDGGHFLTLCVEAVRGKPLSPTALRYTQNVGIVLLLLLMLLATKNDIVRVIFGG